MITLATLPKVGAQAVFNQAARHLLKQNKKSYRRGKYDGQCLYRDGKGNKCAAGCFISSREYEFKNMSAREGDAWDMLINLGIAPEKHSDLILELQNVHDSYPASQWPRRLRKVADNFGLKFDLKRLKP